MLTSLAYPSRLLSLSLIFLPLPLSPCNICHIYLITSLRSHLYDIFNLESRTFKFCSLCQLCIIASALLSARLNYSNSRSTSSKSGEWRGREKRGEPTNFTTLRHALRACKQAANDDSFQRPHELQALNTAKNSPGK